ncbi:hypothetical protein P692DRAFT_20821424 [Suillus brevipes Sb2]|nr:hypothetical protein P692DRAFT_20821424 [Suillus brevipes Sb2]
MSGKGSKEENPPNLGHSSVRHWLISQRVIARSSAHTGRRLRSETFDLTFRTQMAKDAFSDVGRWWYGVEVRRCYSLFWATKVEQGMLGDAACSRFFIRLIEKSNSSEAFRSKPEMTIIRWHVSLQDPAPILNHTFAEALSPEERAMRGSHHGCCARSGLITDLGHPEFFTSLCLSKK